jgi:hypothetical protein
MTRQRLEKLQVWVYLVAILTGLLLGSRSPASAGVFEALLWAVLGCLLYATFTQVPLARLRKRFKTRASWRRFWSETSWLSQRSSGHWASCSPKTPLSVSASTGSSRPLYGLVYHLHPDKSPCRKTQLTTERRSQRRCSRE